MKVANSPCNECAVGKNSLFPKEVQSKMKQDMANGLMHTCHWKENTGQPINHPHACLNNLGTAPYCATSAKAIVALSKKATASDAIKKAAREIEEAEKVSLLGPDHVKRTLPPNTSMNVVLYGPDASTCSFKIGHTPEEEAERHKTRATPRQLDYLQNLVDDCIERNLHTKTYIDTKNLRLELPIDTWMDTATAAHYTQQLRILLGYDPTF